MALFVGGYARRTFVIVIHIVGARPNFIKLAPAHRARKTFDGIEQVLVHSGQHYDINMSDVFF
jgi:UDP-N-acetylglucosamine 2-epimerase (non-hydrolysing)